MKSKFKQTEIGKIPEDWEVEAIKKLGNPKEVVLTGPFGSLLHSSDYAGTGVPLLLVNSIVDGRLSGKELPRINIKKANELKRFWLKEGDIVFTRVGVVGRTLYIDKEKEGWMLSGQTLRIRFNNPKVYPKFIDYYFRSPTATNLSENTSLGTTRPSINTAILANRLVPIPPLPEQRAIAKALSGLDSKIELNQQMNKTLEAICQALFKHWFVDFEFPNEEGKPYKRSGGEMVHSEELGREIPKGWEVKPIDEIADFLNGLALQKFPAQEDEEYLPVIKIRELRQGITESSDKANLSIPEEYIVDDGDILFSWSGSLEVVIWGHGKGALNQHLFKVTSKDYPKWLFYNWIIHHLSEYRHIAEGKATTMGHIQRHHLKSSLVVVPDEKTLVSMNRVLSPLIERIVETKVESRSLSQIRDMLLPRLMSGKIRVKVEKVLSHA